MYVFTFLFHCSELGTEFEFVGIGFCRSRCHAMGDPCEIDQYIKSSSSIDECQLTCKNEAACTGFAIADKVGDWSSYRNACRVYGNISSTNVDSWINPDAWDSDAWNLGGPWPPKSRFGYEAFKVTSSDLDKGRRCFKRLDEGGNNDGKF